MNRRGWPRGLNALNSSPLVLACENRRFSSLIATGLGDVSRGGNETKRPSAVMN